MALESVRANKLRSALATLGIVIGVFTVTLMATAIIGLRRSFESSIGAIGADVLYIQRFEWGPSLEWWKVRARRKVTLEQGRRLAERATLAQAVTYEVNFSGTVRFEDKTARGVFVSGTTELGAFVRGLVIRQGRFLTEREVIGARPVCILGNDLAEALFPMEDSLDKIIQLNGRRYQVIGVAAKMGQFLFGNLDNQIILPVTRVASDLLPDPEVSISVKIGDTAKLDEAREELRGLMRTIRKVPLGEADDFSINNQSSLLNAFGTFTRIIGSAGLFITGLSLFVGAIGIMNIMFVSVAERTREIGVRKALGARQRAILLQFLLEGAVICLLGGLVALALAWPATRLMQKWLPATLSPFIVMLALGVSGLTGMVAGFLPARRAAKLNPVDALRSE